VKLPGPTHLICHCRSEQEATLLKDAIKQRFETCRLELHPQKTLIAYCKDGRRTYSYPNIQFNFLGFSFRPRLVKGKGGGIFLGFVPAISQKSALSVRQSMRSWQLHRRSDLSIDDIARRVNPAVRGWINYYGSYYRSALYRVFEHLDDCLMRWAMRKYKDLLRRPARARAWVLRLKARQPSLFAHWTLLPRTTG
jgi:RNA-directed DNA polymerase